MSLNIIVIHKPIGDAIHVTLSIFIYSLYSYFLTDTYLKNGDIICQVLQTHNCRKLPFFQGNKSFCYFDLEMIIYCTQAVKMCFLSRLHGV